MKLDLDQVVTVDFESFFDSDYSLRVKELTTSGYVRDDRFLAHCVSIKEGNEPTKVFWYEQIVPALAAIDWDTRDLLCHNTAFDGFILNERYGIKPRRYLDTMSMGQALFGNAVRVSLEALCQFFGIAGKNKNILGKMKGHREIPQDIREEAELYCKEDTDKCWHIFKRMIEPYPDDEIALIDWTIRQFCDPVLRVDVARAKAELEREQQRKQELIAKTGLDEDQLQSAAKFAAQLRNLGVEPPMKISPRTKLETFAFSQQDEEFMALVTHENQAVRELVQARLAAKSTIGETRAQRFVDIGENTLPVGYRYAAAHTLRWGGTNKCLSGDSVITVKQGEEICDILLYRLSHADLVWDGDEFVQHNGLLDQGIKKVISHDGITGTEDHIVFCGEKETPTSLRAAKSKKLSLTTRMRPTELGQAQKVLPSSQRPLCKPEESRI